MPVPTGGPRSQRTLLRDEAYREIGKAIITGQLVPGERLRDSELQKWLGFSRTPIREAILRLERAGLIVSQPHRGTVVAPYAPELTRQARQVAAKLHALATELAVPQLTDDHITILTQANARLAETGGDVQTAVTADDDFHDVFIKAADNQVLTEQLAQVMPMLRRAEYLHFESSAKQESLNQHEAIIAACRAKDAAFAVARVTENWQSLQD